MAFNVLVVDDSRVMRTMVIRSLKMSGISLGEIHQAGNGVEALEVMKGNWVDLALVDINMPVMNGEELIEEVRASPELRDMAIIVVSTESSQTRIDKVQKQGARFVHKPFSPEELRAQVVAMTGVADDIGSDIGVGACDEFSF